MEGGLPLTWALRITEVEAVFGEQCFPYLESVPRGWSTG